MEGVASVLIIFEIDGLADIHIKQTNKFPSEASTLLGGYKQHQDVRTYDLARFTCFHAPQWHGVGWGAHRRRLGCVYTSAGGCWGPYLPTAGAGQTRTAAARSGAAAK